MPRLRLVNGQFVEDELPHEAAKAGDYTPPVIVPEVAFGGPSVNPRDTREQMYRQILDHTDGTPAAREWAREKADSACRNWSRGVSSGEIKNH